jgi:hypothetical protein
MNALTRSGARIGEAVALALCLLEIAAIGAGLAAFVASMWT